MSRVNPGYPGPKQAGPDGERLRLKDGALYDEALKYCINCKRCEVACPSDVKIGDIIQRARAKYDTTRPSLRNFVLSHTDLMGSVSTPCGVKNRSSPHATEILLRHVPSLVSQRGGSASTI